jgi:hypothetical protein
MKSLALAAAAGVAVVLTACSHSAAAPPASAGQPVVTHSAAPVNCPRAYDAWKHGPAKKVLSALDAVGAAVTAKDLPARTAALKKARPAVVKAARYPLPACADPKGYWTTLLMHVNAATATSGSASITSVLKSVPGIERQLKTELKSVTKAK